MKIWLVHQYAIPPSQAGFTRPFDLARALVRRGHQVALITAGFDHMAQRETRQYGASGYSFELHSGVNFVWLKTPRYFGSGAMRVWNMIAFAWRVWRGGWSASLDSPDVIIGSSPSLFAALGAERLSRRMAVPFVLEIRDLWPDALIELGGYSKFNPLIWALRGIERFLYRRATRIVGVQQHLAPYLSENGASPGSYTWLPNSSPLLDVPMPGREARGSQLTAMYAGSFSGTNITFLKLMIDVAEQLASTGHGKNIFIRLVGDGPERNELLQRVSVRKLDNIRIEQAVPRSEVGRLLAEADVFLLAHPDSPLFRWGMSPNKLVDYLAMGRPIISAVRAKHNPIGDIGACVLTNPNVADIADTLVKLSMLHPDELGLMGSAGRVFAMAHHSLPRMAERLETVLLGATTLSNRIA